MRAAPGSLVLVFVLAASLGSCGPERTFTGVWRLEACHLDKAGDAGPDARDQPVCGDDPFTYELHLGRFGSDVTGLLVKYAVPGPDLDAFDAQNDCGCLFLQSGAADDTSVRFQVQTDNPGCAEPGGSLDPERGCGRPSVALCNGAVRFDLRGDDQELTGTLKCVGEDGGAASTLYDVRFRSEPGRPRTRCFQCSAP